MNPKQANTQGIQDAAPRVENPDLAQSTCGVKQRDREALFIAALRGETVTDIDRYQVYSDYTPDRTVVFIHDPRGQDKHKYIIAEAGQHVYIVAAPMEWTAFHEYILRRVSEAAGEEATCYGGGYVDILDGGYLKVYGQSIDFGTGDHTKARDFFSEAVRRTGKGGAL